MLLSFLLWLSIGGLYDLSLISYALSSTNDNTRSLQKHEGVTHFGCTLPIGRYKDVESGNLELIIKNHGFQLNLVGREPLTFNLQIVEKLYGNVCYRDSSNIVTLLDMVWRRYLRISKVVTFMPSLVQLCHSGDGRVWIRDRHGKKIHFTQLSKRPHSGGTSVTAPKNPLQQVFGDFFALGTPQTGLQFKTSQALKALAQKRIDSKKAKITDGEERKAREANVEKQVHSREKLGDGEDLVARAMREAGSNEEASLENEESPTPHKLRRPSRGSIGEAKSVIDGGKSPQPGNDMTANSKGASGDSSNVKELDYTKPSSSRIDTKKDEDGEAEGRGDGRSEVGRRSDGLKILGAKASGDVFGTFNDLSNRSMVSPDDPGSPQLTSYTFDDLLDEWDRY